MADDAKDMLFGLTTALNSNGLAFQFASVEAVRQARQTNESRWKRSVVEFPTNVDGADGTNTHIDFVLQHDDMPWMLAAECKRIHPSYSRWVFLGHMDTSLERGLLVDSVLTEKNHITNKIQRTVECTRGKHPIATCHFAFALKRDDVKVPKWECPCNKNNERDPRTAIDQACLGANGLIDYLSKYGAPDHHPTWHVLPVVITTAELWTCKTNLSKADLASGNVVVDPKDLKQVNFVVFQSAVSSTRKTPLSVSRQYSSLPEGLQSLFLRTVVVVHAPYFAEFLGEVDGWLHLE